MSEDRLIYETNLVEQLAQWKADLHLLKVKDESANSEVTAPYDDSIDALQQKHDEASYHLSSLKGASDEAWESVKASNEKGWMKVKSAFQSSPERPRSASSKSEEPPGLSLPE